MLKKITFIFLNRCWQLIAFIIILFAVLVSVARFMIPSLNEYRIPLENMILEQTGIKLTIGHIEGSWESLGPVIKVSDIQFGHDREDSTRHASIDLINIKVATFPTLFYQTLVTEQLVIEGLSLNIVQDESAEFTLSNIKTNADELTDINKDFASDIQSWLQHQSQIVLFETHLNISLKNEGFYPVILDTIQFKKGKDIYQIIGLSNIPGDNQIAFTLEVDGFLSDPKTIGSLYIDTYNINMPQLPLSAFWEETDILSGAIELKLWADWKNSQFESALLSIKVEDFLMSLKEQPQTKINKVNGYLVWSKQEAGWKIESKNLELISQDRSWPDPSLFIEMEKNAGVKQYSYSASSLDLGIWADFILTNPNLADDIRNQLFTMNPNGFIKNVSVMASVDNQDLLKVSAQGDFFELTWNAWESIPGTNNISGHFELHKDNGLVTINSSDVELDYPSMFRWPLKLDKLNSHFSWQRSDNSTTFQLANLSIDLLGAQLLADGIFNYSTETPALEMNLYSELHNVDLKNIKTLLPVGTMSTSLVDYLDKSVKAGLLHSTKVALRGKSTDFPFANPDGVFLINALVDNTRFVFYDGWPEISNISADLLFIENRMDIKLSQGESDGIKLSNTSAIIDDFAAEPSILKISNLSTGNFVNGINYLNNSPLKNSVGKVFDVIPTRGPFSLNLDLTIPLGNDKQENEKSNIIVDGIVQLDNNTLIVKPIDMFIENIQGKIKITDSLIYSEQLTAQVLGGLSKFNLKQSIDSGLLMTTIDGSGELTIEKVREVFPNWIPSKLKGNTQYQLGLLFPEVLDSDDTLLKLSIDTNLKGISSELPRPFTKSAEEEHNYSLRYQLFNDNNQMFEASIEDFVDLKLQYSDYKPPKGQIMFGKEKALIPERDGIELAGQLGRVDLEFWLNELNEKDESKHSFEANQYAYFYINELVLDELNYYFLNFSEVKVSAVIDEKLFKFKLSGDEISGDITIPDSTLEQPIDINLATIMIKDQFPLAESDTGVQRVNDPLTGLDETIISQSQPLPPIKLQCQECFYNELNFGAISINLTPIEKGNSFTVNSQDNSIFGINVIGDWSRNSDDIVFTQLSGSFETANLGNLLDIFNLNSGIRDTDIKTQGNLSWQGDLSQINFESLTGKMAIDGGKGSQEYVSDKGARIFSILSLGSLARKLTLDFSDLFEEGFFYTDLKANVNINQGVFSTTDFEITGTSADVEIIGSSDFVNNRIENCILVNPDLSASLPILAGWAIEPVTGLVVFLMSKIFQPALKVVTAIQYKVEGSFDDPMISEIGKSEGTAIIDNTSETVVTTFIRPDPEQPKFSCDGAFNN